MKSDKVLLLFFCEDLERDLPILQSQLEKLRDFQDIYLYALSDDKFFYLIGKHWEPLTLEPIVKVNLSEKVDDIPYMWLNLIEDIDNLKIFRMLYAAYKFYIINDLSGSLLVLPAKINIAKINYEKIKSISSCKILMPESGMKSVNLYEKIVFVPSKSKMESLFQDLRKFIVNKKIVAGTLSIFFQGLNRKEVISNLEDFEVVTEETISKINLTDQDNIFIDLDCFLDYYPHLSNEVKKLKGLDINQQQENIYRDYKIHGQIIPSMDIQSLHAKINSVNIFKTQILNDINRYMSTLSTDRKLKYLNDQQFIEWCNKEGELQLSNISETIIKIRKDLNSFNEKTQSEFNEWFNKYGFRELELYFLKPFLFKDYSIKKELTNEKSIDIVGYHGQILGLGIFASYIENYFKSKRYEVNQITLQASFPSGRLAENVIVTKNSEEAFFIVGMDQVGASVDKFSKKRLSRKKILIPFWELNEITQSMVEDIYGFNFIFAPSNFIFKVLKKYRRHNLYKFIVLPSLEDPGPIDREKVTSNHVVEQEYFLTVFDFNSDIYRKGIFETIIAYKAALRISREIPNLVIKSINSEKYPHQFIEIEKIISDEKKIYHITEIFSNESIKFLYKNAIGYISLHKAEGFGLTLANSIGLKVPCIATAYSGNMDFMSNKYSYLLDYELQSTQSCPESVYSKFPGTWAQPNLKQATDAILALSFEREKSKKMAEEALKFYKKRKIYNDDMNNSLINYVSEASDY